MDGRCALLPVILCTHLPVQSNSFEHGVHTQGIIPDFDFLIGLNVAWLCVPHSRAEFYSC